MGDGWIKAYRQTMESQVFCNSELFHVWMYCLFRAGHGHRWVNVRTGRGSTRVELLPGQFIFGRKTAAAALGMSPSSVRNRMSKLKEIGNVDIQPDTHFSIVTIVNWAIYQNEESGSGQATGHPKDNQRTTKGQPKDTNKNEKNEKNGKKITNTSLALTIGKDWNFTCGPVGLKTIRLPVSKKRMEKLTTRLQEMAWQDGRHQIIFDTIVKYDFLHGNNKQKWAATFDWIIHNDTNYQKVLEGFYEQTDKTRKPPKSGLFDEPERFDL